MSGYKELKVYKRSYKAEKAIYEMTVGFPNEERYGITNQLRRAALSIPLNIAEGYAKTEGQEEFKRFLMMALGSSNEVLVLVDFSKDVGYISDEKHRKASAEYEEIASMLNSFIQSVKTKV